MVSTTFLKFCIVTVIYYNKNAFGVFPIKSVIVGRTANSSPTEMGYFFVLGDISAPL